MNNRSLVVLALAALFFAASSQLHAQALPTATRNGILQVGGGITNASTDEFKPRITGITGYATFDIRQHFGIEADVHMLSIITPSDFVEKSYLLGARYVFRHGHLDPYIRVMAGIGQTSIQLPSPNRAPGTPGTYLEYAGAGGLDIRLSHHINVRAIDFEYQTWPNFPPNGLSPILITCGAAYRFN
jgi:Outer membrane protein beta-barrel domain